MSSWMTLNIPGLQPDDLPSEFDDWHTYTKDDQTVAYSFNSGMDAAEAATQVVEASEGFEPAVDRVLVLRCDDTSDYVTATFYRSQDVKYQGVRPGVKWSGHHSLGRDDSEFLRRTPEGPRPVFGGNWTDCDGQEAEA